MSEKIDYSPIHAINTFDQVIVSTDTTSIIIDLKNGYDVEIKQNSRELYLSWLTLYVGYSFLTITIDNIVAVGSVGNQLYITVKSL